MISERNKSKVQIFLLLVVFVLFIMLANNIFKGFRFDLTENKLYTLGDGTLNIINDLSEDIGISREESKSLVDIAISSSDLRYVDYQQLKDEITTFLVINIFFLICKL